MFRVITGVRLIKDNGILSIKIQQGSVQANGSIDQSSVAWKPINYKTKKRPSLFLIKSSTRILLDVVEAPPGHVLTGLSFESSKDNQGTDFLWIKIRTTKLDYATGELNKKSKWIEGDTEIDLKDR